MSWLEGDAVTLGQKLRDARKTRRMTQRALADGTLSISFISMLEHDRVRPSLETLRVLADRLGRPLGDFLESVSPEAQQVQVEVQRGESLLRQHQFTAALQAFVTAAAAAEQSGDPVLRARVELGRGQALAGLRQFDLAESHLRQARVLAEASARFELMGAAANALGFLAFRARRFVEAREIFEAGVHDLRRAGFETGEVLGKLLANLGRTYVEVGFPAQAAEYYRQAALALEQVADPTHRALLYYNLGVASERQRSFELARRYFEQAAELFGLLENLRLLSVVRRSQGILFLEQGAYADAGVLLEHSLRLAREMNDDEGVAQTLVELARARAALGALDQAEHAATEAETLAARIGDTAEVGRARAAKAEVLWKMGQLQEAAGRFEAALAIFEQLSMRTELVRAYRDLGFVLMGLGDAAGAAARFARAFELQGAHEAARMEEASP